MSGADYTYESQNDQQLDDLHSKIRTLRHVTIDIHNDAQRQNTQLDDTGNTFTSFANSLMSSTRQANRAFGINGGTKQWRIILYLAGGIVSLWLAWHILGGLWWWWTGTPTSPP